MSDGEWQLKVSVVDPDGFDMTLTYGFDHRDNLEKPGKPTLDWCISVMLPKLEESRGDGTEDDPITQASMRVCADGSKEAKIVYGDDDE